MVTIGTYSGSQNWQTKSAFPNVQSLCAQFSPHAAHLNHISPALLLLYGSPHMTQVSFSNFLTFPLIFTLSADLVFVFCVIRTFSRDWPYNSISFFSGVDVKTFAHVDIFFRFRFSVIFGSGLRDLIKDWIDAPEVTAVPLVEAWRVQILNLRRFINELGQSTPANFFHHWTDVYNCARLRHHTLVFSRRK